MTEAFEHTKGKLVEWVVDRLYERHPDWLSKFGSKGRKSCVEDISYHADFLYASLLGKSSAPFCEYCRWLGSMLPNRGVQTAHILESIRLIQQYIEEHLPSEISAQCLVIIEAGCDTLASTEKAAALPAYFNYLPEASKNLGTFTDALIMGDGHRVDTIVQQQFQQGLDSIDIGIQLIQPAMYEIGLRWETNRITVAQEHLATALAQTLLARNLTQTEYAPRTEHRALFACIPGNHHILGLRMVSDAFEIGGWDVQYLGADIPFNALLSQTDQWKPDLLGLSISTLNQLPVLKFCLGKLRSELGNACPALMVGGLAMNQAPELKSGLGADIWAANARQAFDES